MAKTETIGDNSISSQSNASSSTCDQLKDFRFITWNIDGLNEKNIRIRTEAVCNKIKSENAIIVFLQEVIPTTESILRQNLPKYEFFSSNENVVDYYTLTLINKDLVKVESNEIIDFEETSMGRNLLKTRVIKILGLFQNIFYILIIEK
jgi:tyrosyl-DNA phosphodiesterase 2